MFDNFNIQLFKYMFLRNKELFLELVDKMNLMVLILERNGSIKYFNQHAATFHNWDIALPIKNHNYKKLCQQLRIDVSSFMREIPSVFEGKTIDKFEARITTPKTKYYLLMCAIALEDDVILIVAEDITSSKMKEFANQELNSYLPAVFKHFPVHFFWKDKDSTYLGADEGYLKLCGFLSFQEIKGLTDFDCPWKKEQAISFIDGDKTVFKTLQPKFNMLEEITFADKQTYPIIVSKVPLFSDNNQLIGEIGLLSKLTDAAHNKLAFFMANDILQESIIPQNRKYCLPNPHDNTQKVYLSLREKQCLDQWVLGKISKEIARNLGISYRTVEIHINNIKHKLNLHSRSALIEFYLTYQGFWIDNAYSCEL
jgi:DNA-binding CsgD family transcriptional regulator/PAS domain-containing protein